MNAEMVSDALSNDLALIDIEKRCLELRQESCVVRHYFGPGVAIREVSMKAGTFAIGHKQKFHHLNLFEKGRVIMFNYDGTKTEISAPMVFVGGPGKKVGYIAEDTIWKNVYSTTLATAAEVEDFFIEKSGVFEAKERENFNKEQELKGADRDDFDKLLIEYGLDRVEVLRQSENEADLITIPLSTCSVRNSPISGKGLFSSVDVTAGEAIIPARVYGLRTQAGRYINHAKSPNARMTLSQNGDAYVVAIADIKGCCGGNCGDEITVSYRDVIEMRKGERLCRV